MKEMYIITPADSPKEKDMNRWFVLLENSAIRLPMPVARPAKSDRANAYVTCEDMSACARLSE